MWGLKNKSCCLLCLQEGGAAEHLPCPGTAVVPAWAPWGAEMMKRGSPYPDRQIRGSWCLVQTRKEQNLVSAAHGFPSGESVPVPRGGRCCLLGTTKTTLPKKCRRRGESTHLHSAGRFQAGLALLHSAQPFLLHSLLQALCTSHFTEGLFAPHPLHVKPIPTPSSPFFCTLLKDSDCQYQRGDGAATRSCCCSLLALCPFPSPQAPTVPSGFCSLPETFIIRTASSKRAKTAILMCAVIST